MGQKDKVRVVEKTHRQQKYSRKYLLIIKEREENCGRGRSPFMVGFITQKGNFRLDGAMNEGVKRKYLRLRKGWALSFTYIESSSGICAYA